jgi:chemotaxis protein MotA
MVNLPAWNLLNHEYRNCLVKEDGMTKRLVIIMGALAFLLLAGTVVSDTSWLTNLQSAAMVLGGTLLSAVLAYSPKTLIDLTKSFKQIYQQEEADHDELVKLIAKLAYIARLHGMRALEEAASKSDNRFLKRGIELVADGYDRYEIRNIMENEYEIYFSRKEAQSNLLNTMAKLAPVFGFVGTIIGLINVLSHLGHPQAIGQGMALALLTTFYGLLFANVVFLPMARKYMDHLKAESTILNMILEGIVDISDDKNSRAITHRLNSYLAMYNGTEQTDVPLPDGGRVLRMPVNPFKQGKRSA